MLEEDIQKQVIAARDLYSPRIPILGKLYHIPNARMSKGEAGRMKALGVRKGMPDLHLPHPGMVFHSLYLEMKRPGGKLSKDQEDCISDLKASHNEVQVCWSFEAAILNLAFWLFEQSPKHRQVEILLMVRACVPASFRAVVYMDFISVLGPKKERLYHGAMSSEFAAFVRSIQ
jgi:hypothetical protein